MDINFKCRQCDQDLSVDATGAGSEIQCPACGTTIVIPVASPEALTPHVVNPMATSAAAREGPKHFAVPSALILFPTIISNQPSVRLGGWFE